VVRLRAYVMRSIEPFATLDDWIVNRECQAFPSNPELRKVPYSNEQRREARMHWIDWVLGTRTRYERPQAPVLKPITVTVLPRIETLVQRGPIRNSILRNL
jgi:hypothetical protein